MKLKGWHQKFKTAAQDTGLFYDIEGLKNWPVPALKLLNEYRRSP